MKESIAYYFTSVSPFAYLGHKRLVGIAAKHGCEIKFKPIDLGKVWEMSGSVPLGKRSAVRQRYRSVELQRIARMYDIRLNVQPKYFPTDPTMADRCICSLVDQGRDPAYFAFSLGRAVWENELQISDLDVLADLLTDCGFDAHDCLSRAATDEVEMMRQANSRDAIFADAIGAPAYVFRGEVFWGQDRLDQLDHMIQTGRAPFTPKL